MANKKQDLHKNGRGVYTLLETVLGEFDTNLRWHIGFMVRFIKTGQIEEQQLSNSCQGLAINFKDVVRACVYMNLSLMELSRDGQDDTSCSSTGFPTTDSSESQSEGG